MAANHTETYTLNVNIQSIYEILGDPRFYEGYKLTFLSSAPVQNGAKYRCSTNVNFSSWGEYIDIDALFVNENTTQITIKSECAMPTQFEIWTAAAFIYFAKQNCDIVVLETGLGGRD